MRDMPMTTDMDLWVYRDYDAWEGAQLTGYAVEALDGEIGSVDEATYETNGSFVVVDTGPWVFGKRAMLPAGVIDRIDTTERRVFVNRTKDQIQNAPEFDEATYRDETYRTGVGDYYGRGGAGYREWDV